MPNEETKLSCSNISVSFDGKPILDDVSITISPGRIVAILGPSGVGKTTLLRAVGDLLEHAVGTRKVSGRWAPNPRFGHVFQEAHLLPWSTVLNNAQLAGQFDHDRRAIIRERASSLLQEYGLWDFRHHLPSELSGGMQQRVSLIRALSAEPDILMLDEPFNQTDFLLRRRLLKEVSEVVDRGELGCLLVTHDLEDATLIANEIVLLMGQPAEVVERIEITADREARILQHPDTAAERTRVGGQVLDTFQLDEKQ